MIDLKPRALLVVTTPVILYAFLLINGMLGIDFGKHWDEGFFVIQAQETFESGILLPSRYIYPSFCYDLTVIGIVVYRAILGNIDIATLAQDYNFYLFMRFVYCAIASLTVVWVYVLAFKIGERYWPSLVAGLVVCSSFEFSYHSRWAVSDCVAVQFATLSTLFVFLNISRRSKILLGALVAGIAAGTKYTAGIVCVNVLALVLDGVRVNRKDAKAVAVELGFFCASLFAGFVLTTPGSILEMSQFLQDLAWQKGIYSTGHLGYTVAPGLGHVGKILCYTALSLFSKNSAISAVVFAAALLGAFSLLMRRQWHLFCLFGVMVLYIAFVASFDVMIVRNLLVILPFFALLASLGCRYLGDWIQAGRVNVAIDIGISALLCYSCSSVVVASLSVYNKDKIDMAQEVQEYIQHNRGKKFYFSPKALALKNVQNNADTPSEGSYVMFFKDEIPYTQYRANVFNQFVRTIGVDDVNFNYYPTWSGVDRIVVARYDPVAHR
jgi:hypothetical protein